MNIELLEARIEALEDLVREQQKQIQKIEDTRAIKRLQRAYGYYVQHMMRDEIIDCFADRDDVSLHWLEGTWKGKAGVKRYFGAERDPLQQPPPEFLHQVMQLSGVVDVDDDGVNARGRWYAFGGVSVPFGGELKRQFCSGVYEVGYVKEDGVWKILAIDWTIQYSAKIPEGAWETQEMTGEAIMNFKGPDPDVPPIADDPRFVNGYIFPFHYSHPVTGKPTSEEFRNSMLPGMKKV